MTNIIHRENNKKHKWGKMKQKDISGVELTEYEDTRRGSFEFVSLDYNEKSINIDNKSTVILTNRFDVN